MATFQHFANDIIVVGNTTIPLALFWTIEPNYRIPHDCMMLTYDPSVGRIYRRHPQVSTNGSSTYTIAGKWEDGDRYLSREREFAALVETDKIETMIARMTVADVVGERRTVSEKRMSEYPPIQDMVVALWEYVMEGRSKRADAIQEIRERVKAKYPKESTPCLQSTPERNSSTTA
jgi:hypothetical protein